MPLEEDPVRKVITAAMQAGAHYDDDHGEWKNASGTITDANAIVLRVDSDEQTQAIFKALYKENQKDGVSLKIRTPQGQFDAFGYLSQECCARLKCPSFLQRTAPLLGKLNPLDASKIDLKSYSQGPQISHDIIIERSDKYLKHKRVTLSQGVDGAPDTATVTPGMTFNDVLRKLAKAGKTLDASPLNTARSVIGSMVNGVDGLQRLVRKFKYIDPTDPEAGIVECDRAVDADFADKIVKARMLGSITEMSLDTTKDMNLEQQVKWAETFDEVSAEEIKKLFTQHDFTTLTYTPTYRDNPHGEHLSIKNVQITYADDTLKHTQNTKKNVLWEEVLEDVADKAFKHGKKELSDALYKTERHLLIPAFQQVVAGLNYAKRGEEKIVDKTSNFLRLKTRHPSNLLQTGMYIPVDQDKVGEIIRQLGQYMDAELKDRYFTHDEAPVSVVTIRPITPTEGGLATTIAGENQIVLSVNVMSNPHAQGINHFLNNLNNYVNNTLGLYTSFDLSRLVPEGKPYFSGREEGAQRFLDILKGLNPKGIGTSPVIPAEYVTLLEDAVLSTEAREDRPHIPMSAIPEPNVQIGEPDEMIQLLKWVMAGVDAAVHHYATDKHADLKEVWTTFHVLALAAIDEFKRHKENKDNPVWERETRVSGNAAAFEAERTEEEADRSLQLN